MQRWIKTCPLYRLVPMPQNSRAFLYRSIPRLNCSLTKQQFFPSVTNTWAQHSENRNKSDFLRLTECLLAWEEQRYLGGKTRSVSMSSNENILALRCNYFIACCKTLFFLAVITGILHLCKSSSSFSSRLSYVRNDLSSLFPIV